MGHCKVSLVSEGEGFMADRKPDESIMVSLDHGQQLHVRRIAPDPDAPSVLLIHGLVEDGTIFYSRQGTGLAYFLAENGYDVFVADLRGKGRSWPPLAKVTPTDPKRTGYGYNLKDAVTGDLMALMETVVQCKGRAPDFCVGHGWGGILLSSFLARYPEYRGQVSGLVHFGSHRGFSNDSIREKLLVKGVWEQLAGTLSRRKGYVPARFLRLGPIGEYTEIHALSCAWLRGEPWVDPVDQFDYGEALNNGFDYPASLYFCSSKGGGFGNPDDVSAFMKEVGSHNGRMVTLGKAQGNLADYSYTGMLTQESATRDHFPFMVNWMTEIRGLARSGSRHSE